MWGHPATPHHRRAPSYAQADESGSKPRQLNGHSGEISDLSFSSDGMLLASASSDQSVRIHNVHAGTILRTLQFKESVTAVAFSPTEQVLAIGCEDGMALLQPMLEADGAMDGAMNDRDLRTFKADGELSCLSFSADGKRLACSELGSKVVVRATSDTAAETVYQYGIGRGADSSLVAAAFSPSGEGLLLAAATSSGAFTLLDISTGETKHTLRGASEPTALALSQDGRLMASANDDDELTIRSAELHEAELYELPQCRARCMSSVVSAGGGQCLVSAETMLRSR